MRLSGEGLVEQEAVGGGYAHIKAALVALTMAVALGSATASAEDPQARPGERVRVSTVTAGVGTTHQDELIGVLQSLDVDGLTVLADARPDAVKVPASAIRRLEVSRGRHRPSWAMPTLVGGGALVGGLTGAIIGYGTTCTLDYCASDAEVSHSTWTGTAVGAAVGAAGGLLAASLIHKELWGPASLPDWAHAPKVTLGLAPVRRGVGIRVSVAF